MLKEACNRFTAFFLPLLFLLSHGCTVLPKPGEPYGYINPEGAIYYLFIDGRKHCTGFGNGFHTVDIKVTPGTHYLGYENNTLDTWTDLFVPTSMKKDEMVVLEVEHGMRYYIGPEKGEERFKPVVKKKEKIVGYPHR